MGKVLNKYKDSLPIGSVYIGRGSKWGNPYRMRNSSDKERQRVIQLYKQYLFNQIKQKHITAEDLVELQNKDLVCFCAPKACHGDVLLKYIQKAVEHLNNSTL